MKPSYPMPLANTQTVPPSCQSVECPEIKTRLNPPTAKMSVFSHPPRLLELLLPKLELELLELLEIRTLELLEEELELEEVLEELDSLTSSELDELLELLKLISAEELELEELHGP